MLRCVRRWEQHALCGGEAAAEAGTAGSSGDAPTLCSVVRAYLPPLACISAAVCAERVRRARDVDSRALDRRDASGATARELISAAELGCTDPVVRALARMLGDEGARAAAPTPPHELRAALATAADLRRQLNAVSAERDAAVRAWVRAEDAVGILEARRGAE